MSIRQTVNKGVHRVSALDVIVDACGSNVSISVLEYLLYKSRT